MACCTAVRPSAVIAATTPRRSALLASRRTNPWLSRRRIWRVSRLGNDASASARSPIRTDPLGAWSNMSRTLTSNSDSSCASVSRRLSVAYKRRVESRKFCQDFCSAMSSPGMSLAVRPAIRAAITSCYATQRLWNRPKCAGSSVASMYAIVVESADQLSWQQVPDVTPSRGEVLVKVSAAGVNRADLLQAAGLYPPPPGASELLGMEVSGVVEAVGDDVAGWAPGQEVCALLAGGGYAEYVAVPAGQLLPHPVGVDLQDSAALPEVACTVWSNLAMTAHLSEGQLLLMHGGASGGGSHAIQVARALGARVAVTAGSAAKLESCRELGAEILINYRDEDFVERVREATDGAGADVIFDIMGA